MYISTQEYGMKINVKKTKAMHISHNSISKVKVLINNKVI